MIDLTEPDVFSKKLKRAYSFNQKIIEAFGHNIEQKKKSIYEQYIGYGRILSPYICDISVDLFNAHKKGASILFEGAQGISLDVDHGVYPYTTSSNTVAGHLAAGTGISFRDIHKIIGVTKAYLSRVGQGPLPTELDGIEAETLREKGGEYGTTTGRPRRVGWLDLVQVRQAVRANGLSEIALTKLDILSGFSNLPVCHSYKINSREVKEMPASLSQFKTAEPVYEMLEGWGELTSDMIDKGFNSLPSTLQTYVQYIEDEVGCPISIISMGPQRHETIMR